MAKKNSRQGTTGNAGGNDDVTKITPRIGRGFLFHHFTGSPFMMCVIELVKDARDWEALKLFIDTRDKESIEFRDNGKGMDAKNREAFASVSCTTANGPKQQGRYGSGSKYMLFSFASAVEVLTAPKDEPDCVYRFTFDTQTYEERVLLKQDILPERVRKTTQTWPYPHPFGTVIRYRFSDPRARGILRGDKLASELTARLPCKFSDIVEVDGKPIPGKEIVGQRIDLIQSDSALGEVIFELYRPKNKRGEEGLFISGGEVGEVPFVNFYRRLGDLADLVPPLYLQNDVCGTITSQFLSELVTERRDSVTTAVADSKFTSRFLFILDRVAPYVQRSLQIKLEQGTSDERHSAALDEVFSLFSARYDKSAPPPGQDTKDKTTTPPEIVIPPPDDKHPLALEARREYEIGETIEIEAKVRKDLATKIDLKNVQWKTDRSRAVNPQVTQTGIRLTADAIGPGLVSIDLPGTPYSATVHYSVVSKREFKLSIPHATIPRGSQIWVMAVHTDKLVGPVEWVLRGVGEIERSGNRVTYHAQTVGRAEIRAQDSRRKDVYATCDITVEPVDPKTFPIRDQRFTVATHRMANHAVYSKPVTMQLGSGPKPVHKMIVNVMGHGYQSALESGDPSRFLAHAIAMEYARFSIFEIQPLEEGRSDPRDAATLANDVLTEGFKLIAEILDQAKGKK